MHTSVQNIVLNFNYLFLDCGAGKQQAAVQDRTSIHASTRRQPNNSQASRQTQSGTLESSPVNRRHQAAEEAQLASSASALETDQPGLNRPTSIISSANDGMVGPPRPSESKVRTRDMYWTFRICQTLAILMSWRAGHRTPQSPTLSLATTLSLLMWDYCGLFYQGASVSKRHSQC
jgi:hypothetical protein